MFFADRHLFAAGLGLMLLTADFMQGQNPSAYFIVRGNIANGDQFDPGFPYHFDSSTGGGSKSRAIPNTSGYGNQNYTGWGTLTVSASIGASSVTASFQGSMDPVDASRSCNLYYGCGWSPSAGTGYSNIDVYVLGPPGTPYHAVQSDSGSLFDSVTQTKACQGGYGNAQASSSWAGVNGSVSATTEHGTGGFCGIDPPKSGSAAVSLPFTRSGSSTGPTITYNSQTYSYAYSAQTVLGLSIYAEQDPDFTATSRGNVTVNITVTANDPTNSINFVSVDDADPNNPVVKYMVTGNVGTVMWGLDGSVINSLGAPAPGLNTFTVPNIEGLPHALHNLEIRGTNGTTVYADSTSLNTSVLPDQKFANTWQILVTSLSFEDLPHNNVTVNGDIRLSQVLWGIPGQYWDRFISSASVVTDSLLPADAPNDFRTTAAPGLRLGSNYVMIEIPSLGTNTYWGAAFGDAQNGGPLGINVFSKSGLPATFTISGITCKKGNNLYWSCAAWLFATLPNVFTGTLPLTVN